MKLGATGQRASGCWDGLLRCRWRAQEREIEARADALLERFRLDHMRDEYAGVAVGRPAQAARDGARADGRTRRW